ncbi:hypothetical protein HDV01_007204 [Terramyces sp. JEL0728]|nr:hypothetical protein HDV01_007204 [Terramyces sp. JEL0728]
MKQLQVRVGTDADNLKPISPNNEDSPVYIDNDIFAGYIVVRVKGNSGECSKYFANRSRMFSMQVSGKFKKEFSGDDIQFGAVFDNPIKPPYGTQIGLAVANLIDPSLKADLYCQKPWLLSPVLCSMNVISVSPPEHTTSAKFGSWPWKQGVDLAEDCSQLHKDHKFTSIYQRRNFYKHKEHRSQVTFKPDRIYNFEVTHF